LSRQEGPEVICCASAGIAFIEFPQHGASHLPIDSPSAGALVEDSTAGLLDEKRLSSQQRFPNPDTPMILLFPRPSNQLSASGDFRLNSLGFFPAAFGR
jgi:hypothetical protein